MLTIIENDIMFDDAAILEKKFGSHSLKITAENLSPDCNYSGYTSIEEVEAVTNYHDCTNNLYISQR